MKRKILLAIFSALMVIMAGCSSNTTGTVSEKHLDAAIFWIGEDLDPAHGWNAWTLTRTATTEHLATINENMEIVPQLSDSWEVIDPLTWKFHIRQGVKFSNGKELTPEDVKKSIERAVSMDDRAKANAKLDSITVDGEYIIYKTTEPYSSLLENLTEPLFSIIDTDQSDEDIAKAPIGTGPYAIVSFTPQEEIKLEANKEYWGGTPGLDTISVKIIPDDDARLLALQSGDIQMAQRLGATALSILKDDADYTIKEVESLRVLYLAFNHNNEFFSDIRVREAISSAIDREKLTTVAAGEPAGALFPKIANFGYDKLKLQEYNLENAKAKLAEAGFVDSDGDGIVEKDGKKLSFTIAIAGDAAIAETVQAQLKDVGIEMNIQLLESTVEVRESKSFEALLLNYVTATTGDARRFLSQNYSSTGTDNFGDYKNEEFDAVVKELSQTFDEAKKLELIIKAQQIVNDDTANVFLMSTKNNTVTKNNVQNVIVHPIDYYFLTKDVTIG